MVKFLKRQSVMNHAKINELVNFDQLIDEGKILLGYSASEYDLAPKYLWPCKKTKKPLTLCRAMKKLGISPFVPETVAEYKQQKLLDLKLRASLRVLGRQFVWIFLVIFLVSLMTVVLEILFDGRQIQSRFNWFLALSALPLSACLVTRWLCRDLPDGFLWDSWILISLEQYRQPIPEFALYSAVELKKLCPEAVFYIDELPNLDPFLVVEYKGEYYWIEVWDEPGFKQERAI